MSLYANRAKTLVVVSWVLVVLLFVSLSTGFLLGLVSYNWAYNGGNSVWTLNQKLLDVTALKRWLIGCGIVGLANAFIELFLILLLTKAVRMRDAFLLRIWLTIHAIFFILQILFATGLLIEMLKRSNRSGFYGVMMFWTVLSTFYNLITVKVVYDLKREVECGGGRRTSSIV